jgi:hypothetical protein
MKVIDLHTHSFPDKIAEKAIGKLSSRTGEIQPVLDGKLSSLIASMDEAGVAVSCVSSIATKPEQASSILEWSLSIRSERIIPIPSFHPYSAEAERTIASIRSAGFAGVKLHPLYQQFTVDDPSLDTVYEQLRAERLFVLFHAGYDIAFPGDDKAAPSRIERIAARFPGLRIIAAHLGGWRDWEESFRCLAGKDIYLDTSFMHEADLPLAVKILSSHSQDRVCYGSDSPWVSQKESIQFVDSLPLSDSYKEKIFSGNAENLF